MPTERDIETAQKQERTAPAPRRVEKVWDYVCDEPKCPKPKERDGVPIRHKTKPVGVPPAKNCDGCGEYNWRKLDGDRTRPVPVKAAEKAKVSAP